MGKAKLIDWHSSDSQWLLSPHLTDLEKKSVTFLQRQLDYIKSHIWIGSSGTTRNETRWIGIGKSAFLASAKAVNEHLQVSPHDIWLNVLPTYHVGGLSIFARASLTGTLVVDHSERRWDVDSFIDGLCQSQATLISLVPTQVHDLVAEGAHAPEHVRAVVVGGGKLTAELYHSARQLDWPLLPSYGLTECCSQVATADLNSLLNQQLPQLKILNHVKVRSEMGRLRLKSPALASYVAIIRSPDGYTLEDPRRGDWLITEDFGRVENGSLYLDGRLFDRVKILGELVSLNSIEEALRSELCRQQGACQDICVFSVPDERKGSELVAIVEQPAGFMTFRDALGGWQARQSALWRLRSWWAVDQFPRSPLGKIQRAKLSAQVGLLPLTRDPLK